MLVLDYCAGGSLSDLMVALRSSGLPTPFLGRFAWHQRLKVAEDVALGVCYLHSLKVVHRDLRPQNILLAQPLTSTLDEPIAKVSDFGVARSLAQELDNKHLSCQVGSWEHMAPEVVEGDAGTHAEYDEKVDVYSFAMVLYELASGQWPFSSIPELSGGSQRIARFVIKGGRPAWSLVSEGVPAIFKSLV